MLPTSAYATTNISLVALVRRLAARPEVDGVVAIGSTGRETLTPASDYDLIVVLNETPVPLNVALTVVDQRLTDIIFVRAAEIALLTGPAEGDGVEQWGPAQLRRWLRAGKILFDRSGNLQAAQASAQATAEPASRSILCAAARAGAGPENSLYFWETRLCRLR